MTGGSAEDRAEGSSVEDGYYFVHLSLHGLIRGHDLELGRDADTGGQCKYVLELVRALARDPRVGRVDLITRQVIDPKVSPEYAEPLEDLGGGAWIRRLPAGPRRYLRKEVLWRYLDGFVDEALAHFRGAGRLPDLIHAHYADAGYVGRQLASLLGCPFVFTGHSLGREKRARLLASGADPEKIEAQYNLSTRIEAEELALDAASLVCTSTHQEVENQYAAYERYASDRMRVIPPGVDVGRFSPPRSDGEKRSVPGLLEPFLRDPGRPAVLAIARADEKKNLGTLVRAFGESRMLRERANLVVVAGNRDRIDALAPGARRVWSNLLKLIDDHGLHGACAYPKHHSPDDIPALFRFASARRGLFVNPALTEPFGLTLIEAAASGLPVLATNDGGPRDILANCDNGRLIDPGDVAALTAAIEEALADREQWDQWSRNGLAGIATHYTWDGHVRAYLEAVSTLLEEVSQPHLITDRVRTSLPLADRLVFTGLEERLDEEDCEAVAQLREIVAAGTPSFGFGVASGRSVEAARRLVETWGLPEPDVLITHLGGEIHYGTRLVPDATWERHLAFRWDPDRILELLGATPGLVLQPEPDHQHRFKISYEYRPAEAPPRAAVQRTLRQAGLPARVLLSENRWLDVIPIRSGKGQAARYVAMRWGLPPERVLFYARRGADFDALSGNFLAVLAGDHAEELQRARNLPRVLRATKGNFAGLLEGIRAYGFDSSIEVPPGAAGLDPGEGAPETVLSPDLLALPDDPER